MDHESEGEKYTTNDDPSNQEDNRYLFDPDADDTKDRSDLLKVSLQIQLSATAVATSFVLIFIPNVETISFTAFMVGLLFPLPFALMTIVTMTLTWEIFASMVFAFSGFVFPFKIVAWLFIGLLGHVARRIGAKYFYEFAIFGAISAFVFDLLVTIPTAFIFLGDETAFLTVLYTNIVFGVVFTISHTVSNALLFGFFPVILRALLPLLEDTHPDLLQLPVDYFDYLKEITTGNYSLSILQIDKRRLLGYGLVAILIVSTLGVMSYTAVQPKGDEQTAMPSKITITVTLDYDGVRSTDTYTLNISADKTVLLITEEIAVVNYTTQYGERPFVEAINNVWQDTNKTNHYWVFYVNGEFGQEGTNSTYLDNNDQLEWRYTD